MGNFLEDVREKHNERYMKRRFGLDHDKHNVPSYFSGWAEITAFVGATMSGKGGGGIARIKDPEKQRQAIELAEKLSELYFEYAWFLDLKGDTK